VAVLGSTRPIFPPFKKLNKQLLNNQKRKQCQIGLKSDKMPSQTSIDSDTESYRRGVVFGLTMAEVLLLLVFCILLFLAIINDKLEEEVKKNNELSAKFAAEQMLNQALTETSKKLSNQLTVFASKIATIPKPGRNSKFIEKMFEAAIIYEATDPKKASELLYALNENPQLLQQSQFSTINEWEELTTLAEYSVSKQAYNVLSNLTDDKKQNFLANVKIASENTPKELTEMQQAAETLQPLLSSSEDTINREDNWPPIISLSEAQNYSFKVGKANLAPQFERALRESIAEEILNILIAYDADVIEVIGHTDPQPMRNNRNTNLDNFSVGFLNSDETVNLSAGDNAGLGYARALSVTKELMKVPALKGYSILPYSAAQMITPDEKLYNESSSYSSSQLRRIEIRVRRKQ
jgi:flagellar motor protein MotB